MLLGVSFSDIYSGPWPCNELNVSRHILYLLHYQSTITFWSIITVLVVTRVHFDDTNFIDRSAVHFSFPQIHYVQFRVVSSPGFSCIKHVLFDDANLIDRSAVHFSFPQIHNVQFGAVPFPGFNCTRHVHFEDANLIDRSAVHVSLVVHYINANFSFPQIHTCSVWSRTFPWV